VANKLHRIHLYYQQGIERHVDILHKAAVEFFLGKDSALAVARRYELSVLLQKIEIIKAD
jgi:hypothetical protein